MFFFFFFMFFVSFNCFLIKILRSTTVSEQGGEVLPARIRVSIFFNHFNYIFTRLNRNLSGKLFYVYALFVCVYALAFVHDIVHTVSLLIFLLLLQISFHSGFSLIRRRRTTTYSSVLCAFFVEVLFFLYSFSVHCVPVIYLKLKRIPTTHTHTQN